MKKKLLFNLILLTAFVFNSCKDIEPIVEDNVPDGQIRGTLAVHVLPSSDKARVSGLGDAEVTVMQGSSVQKVTTDESGIAVFNNLGIGEVAIFVKREGYASYNATGFIGFEGALETPFSDNNLDVFATKRIYLPRKGATVKGAFIGDFDRDNSGSPFPGDSGDYKAGIQVRIEYADKSMQPNVYYVSTNANSEFSLSDLPEGEATISVRHYEKYTVSTEGGRDYTLTDEYYFSDVFNLIADETLDLKTKYLYTFNGYDTL
ncbi:MAG TPA: carboxypeptidase-like regulatory domain-containing protein [Cytophagaceae bacterium]